MSLVDKGVRVRWERLGASLQTLGDVEGNVFFVNVGVVTGGPAVRTPVSRIEGNQQRPVFAGLREN